MRHGLFALLLAAQSAAANEPSSLDFRVQTPDGKPAAGAKVWVYPQEWPPKDMPEPTPLLTDAAGRVSIARTKDYQQVFVRDAAGNIGSRLIPSLAISRDRFEDSGIITLHKLKLKSGTLKRSDDKSVAGATVTPTHVAVPAPGKDGDKQLYSHIDLPKWEQPHWAVKVDASGRFEVPDCGVGLRIEQEGYGVTNWWATSESDLKVSLPELVAVTVIAVGVPAKDVAGQNVVLELQNRPVQPLRVLPDFRGVPFDAAGKATFPGLVPGQYQLRFENKPDAMNVILKAAPVEIALGPARELEAKFIPAATATGRVVDAAGRGVPGVKARLSLTEKHDPNVLAWVYANTDAEGRFTARGIPGTYRLHLESWPEEFAEPWPKGDRDLAEPATIESGKTHAFAPIVIPKAVVLTGKVVFPDGKPAAGASLHNGNYVFEGIHGDKAKITANDKGEFTIKGLHPDNSIHLRVRRDNAVNEPETLVLSKVEVPVTITVSEALAAGISGRVVDVAGKPVAGATVNLFCNFRGVGRHSRMGSSLEMGSTKTDAKGEYTFRGLWPNDRYWIRVTAEGFERYDPGYNSAARVEGSETVALADVTLTRSGRTVRGAVLGPGGQPIAGVELSTVDGPERATTKSAADGRFTLTGFAERPGFLVAKLDGFRRHAVFVDPRDEKPVIVQMAAAGSQPVPPPAIPHDHTVALNDMTRHALMLVWDTRVEFGYGTNAISGMAMVDPATARKWRDDELRRSGGKNDYTKFLKTAERRKTLFDIAKADVIEAVAILSDADAGFSEALQLGRQLLPIDKAKAGRVADVALLKARKVKEPRNILSLAQAGDLMSQAGNAEGRKVILEAADLAEKLPVDENGWNAMAIGYAAAYLAPYDAVRADALLNRLTFARDFNRYLALMAKIAARTDTARAKLLLDRFKPDGAYYAENARTSVACALAPRDPNEAVKIVEGTRDVPHRFLGMICLARVLAPTDRPRAIQLIDDAFDRLEGDPHGYRSYSNYGERAAFAAVAIIAARDLRHPDVPSLIARTLSIRSTGIGNNSSEQQERSAISLATSLALVDPAVARQVLQTIATPEEFIQRAKSKDRNWLFALALADPGRAPLLARQLMDQAKANKAAGNGLTWTGLVELGSILTAENRLKALSGYANMLRELDDDD